MSEPLGPPVFAGRYQFEPVSIDWDRGRSGFTHLIRDIEDVRERLGVIKRAEIKSQHAVEGLKNEVAALTNLKEKGLGVPEVYDTGEAEYGSKKYFYMIIEFIDGIRVEKKLPSLTTSERSEILTQFFGLLAAAHQQGIVNGDVDLKHLFWRRDKKQLIVIDWGNAKLGVDPEKKTEFAYDLARSAEIIFSLVTGRGYPPATGSIALPNDSSLMRGIAPLPVEFRNLCKWAPRTPTEGAKSPYSASELFEVSKNWNDAVRDQKPYRPPPKPRPPYKWTGLAWTIVLLSLAALFTFLGFPGLSGLFPNASATSMLTSTELTPLVSPEAPTLTETQTAIVTFTATPTLQTELTSTASATPIPAISPSPNPLSAPIKVFDNKIIVDLENHCWQEDASLLDGSRIGEGFSRRIPDSHWRFRIEKDRTLEEALQIDFMPCLDNKLVDAIGMDVSIQSLESEREFGFFLEDQNGQRREYTLFLEDARLYLRIRKDNNVTDSEQLILNNLKVNRVSHLHTYYQFSLQIFFEINNQGLDILYLREGRLQIPAKVEEIDPNNNMKQIDEAVLPTLTSIKKIGLIGYGGDSQVTIWPLVFFGK